MTKIKPNTIMKEIGIYVLIAMVFLGLGFGYQSYSESSKRSIVTGNFSEYGVSEINPVIVFAKKGCPACASLEELFGEHSITYTKHDLAYEENKEARTMFSKLGYDIVPIVIVDDTLIPGFQKEEILKVLKNKKLLNS